MCIFIEYRLFNHFNITYLLMPNIFIYIDHNMNLSIHILAKKSKFHAEKTNPT